jgi:hypothetical protein
MKLLLWLFHFIMFLLGAVIRMDSIKHPKLLMLINRIIITIFLIHLITKWI